MSNHQSFPYKIEAKAGKTLAFCACGLTDTPPMCDGTHKTTTTKPYIEKFEEDQTLFICGCQKTKTPPYCDGTHKK